MKIEDQVCPLKQAQILSELELWPGSQFYWLRKNRDEWVIGDRRPRGMSDCAFYSAFTIGEMIEILNKYSNWEFIDIMENMAEYLAEILIEEVKSVQIDPLLVVI